MKIHANSSQNHQIMHSQNFSKQSRSHSMPSEVSSMQRRAKVRSSTREAGRDAERHAGGMRATQAGCGKGRPPTQGCAGAARSMRAGCSMRGLSACAGAGAWAAAARMRDAAREVRACTRVIARSAGAMRIAAAAMRAMCGLACVCGDVRGNAE